MKKRLAALIGSLLLSVPVLLHAQTLNLSVSSTTTGGPTLTPRLVWSTNPAAAFCLASGATGWSGTKGPSGAVTLAPISQSETYTLTCSWASTTGALTLSWTPPTHNDNGTPALDDGELYSDPKGFLIAYGSTTALASSFLVNDPLARGGAVPDLAAGTYYTCVKAINLSDRQSVCSSPVLQKTVTADPTKTINRTVGLVFVKPNPPGDVR
jgi:hypothetical protein